VPTAAAEGELLGFVEIDVLEERLEAVAEGQAIVLLP
jgi:hypothetical protein